MPIWMLQRLLDFLHQQFGCWHHWARLTWHGCPGEPFLQQCQTCALIVEVT